MTEISAFRCCMIEDMTVRNLSPATPRFYVHAIDKFSRFFNRSPEKLDLKDVRAFQVHLVAGRMSWPALNKTVCALRFLYGVTLGRPDLPERIAHAHEPRKLPVVLGTDEVVRFLEAVPSLKYRAALTTAYAAARRASEVTGLPRRARSVRLEHVLGQIPADCCNFHHRRFLQWLTPSPLWHDDAVWGRPPHYWKTRTFNAGLRLDGIAAPIVIDCPGIERSSRPGSREFWFLNSATATS